MNKRHYEHTLPNIRGSLSNTYDASNSVYCIFMIIGIIGYFCVPTVSSWIIQAGGAGAYGQKANGAGKMAGNGAAAVGGAVGGSVAGRIKKMF